MKELTKVIIASICLFSGINKVLAQNEIKISSPNKQLSVLVFVVEGRLSYSINSCGIQVLETSPLGITVDNTDLGKGAKITSKPNVHEIGKSYPIIGNHTLAHNHAKEVDIPVKTLGKKLGAKMKWAADIIVKFDNATIDKILDGAYLINPEHLTTGEEPIYITAEDLEISTDEIPGYEVANKGSLTVALDITITDELKKEGNAREFVNKIQNIRKDNNFELTDIITVKILDNSLLYSSLEKYKEYICGEILADSLAFLPVLMDGTEIEVNNVILKVTVSKKE